MRAGLRKGTKGPQREEGTGVHNSLSWKGWKGRTLATRTRKVLPGEAVWGEGQRRQVTGQLSAAQRGKNECSPEVAAKLPLFVCARAPGPISWLISHQGLGTPSCLSPSPEDAP